MNIAEVQDKELTGDLLELLFKEQALVEHEFAIVEGFPKHLVFGKLENLHLPEVCKHINENILWRMTQEIHEAAVALRNGKTWRQSKYFTDMHEYLDEVADIMIYFINLCLASGIDPKLLAQTVLKKVEVNKKRILSKY